MDQSDIHRVAQERFNGWRNRETFTQLTGKDQPADLDEAYRIQDALYDLMRKHAGFTRIAGHKVALTSPAIQEMCGVDQPAYGAVFEEFIHREPYAIDAGDFIRLGIEFEIAMEIGMDVPVGNEPYDADTIAPYVGAAYPAFELIDDRAADYRHLDAASILTDRCWCNGIVLGKRLEDWQSVEIGNLASEVEVNGTVNDTGNTGAALGHPLNGVAFAANHQNRHGRQLRSGDVIMTGSALATQFPGPGDEITYRVDRLGEVTVRVMS